MTVDNDMGNRAEVLETTCDNDDDVDDDAALAATTSAADTAMRRWVSSSYTMIDATSSTIVARQTRLKSNLRRPSATSPATNIVKRTHQECQATVTTGVSRQLHKGSISSLECVFI